MLTEQPWIPFDYLVHGEKLRGFPVEQGIVDVKKYRAELADRFTFQRTRPSRSISF